MGRRWLYSSLCSLFTWPGHCSFTWLYNTSLSLSLFKNGCQSSPTTTTTTIDSLSCSLPILFLYFIFCIHHQGRTESGTLRPLVRLHRSQYAVPCSKEENRFEIGIAPHTNGRDGVHIDIDRNRWTVWQTQFDDGVVLCIWRHDENSDEKAEKGSSLKWNAGGFEKGGDSLSKRKEERERERESIKLRQQWKTYHRGLLATV